MPTDDAEFTIKLEAKWWFEVLTGLYHQADGADPAYEGASETRRESLDAAGFILDQLREEDKALANRLAGAITRIYVSSESLSIADLPTYG